MASLRKVSASVDASKRNTKKRKTLQQNSTLADEGQNPSCPVNEKDGKISPIFSKAGGANFAAILKRTESQDYDSFQNMDYSGDKVINDCIHGTIRLPQAAIKIIDTPQFQRLRNLMQTGTCHFVYPTATHNRFQHSIGVAHLAGKFAKKLQEQEPGLVDDKDILCCFLAGLCHDLGHGPFSHMWEAFINESNPNSSYHHEVMSIKMLDRLLEENKLRPILLELAGIDETDITFIKEMIVGPLHQDSGLPDQSRSEEDQEWPYHGRGEEKSFLYQIVANKINGMDVDKWDYLCRDSNYLNINIVFDYNRFINFCSIKKTGNPARRRICLRLKEAENLMEMYLDRTRLHKHGYQHRIALIADRMMVDALKLADPYMKIKGSNGSHFSFSGATLNDLKAHESLSDHFVQFKILEGEDHRLIPSQEILNRLNRRDFYKVVGHVDVLKDGRVLKNLSSEEIVKDIHKFLEVSQTIDLNHDDITIAKTNVVLNQNMEKISIYFFDERSNSVCATNAGSQGLQFPERDQQILIRILCRRNSVVQEAKELVQKWKKIRGIVEDNIC